MLLTDPVDDGPDRHAKVLAALKDPAQKSQTISHLVARRRPGVAHGEALAGIRCRGDRGREGYG
jgi:hypothetical protein